MKKNAESAPDDGKMTVEERLQALKGVVERLEQGGNDLDRAFADFESGVKMARGLKKTLDHYERRVEQILADGEVAPLDETEGRNSAEHSPENADAQAQPGPKRGRSRGEEATFVQRSS